MDASTLQPNQFPPEHIRQAQDFAAATNANQGASLQLTTGRLAVVGKDMGWLVGGHPDPSSGRQIPGYKVPGNDLSAAQAHAHIIKSKIIAGEDPTAFAGSWNDHHGETALDVSTHIPKMAAARKEGNDRFQEGIFGLRREPYGNDMQIRRGRKRESSSKKAALSAEKENPDA